jgi:hypothetical protein
MRLLISGSRDFNDYEFFKKKILEIYHDPERKTGSHRIDYIISGGARGVDKMAERFAREYDIPIEVFPAEWGKHGKSAGPIRNRLMLKQKIGEVVCFMAKESLGTKDMLTAAIEAGKPTKVINI